MINKPAGLSSSSMIHQIVLLSFNVVAGKFLGKMWKDFQILHNNEGHVFNLNSNLDCNPAYWPTIPLMLQSDEFNIAGNLYRSHIHFLPSRSRMKLIQRRRSKCNICPNRSFSFTSFWGINTPCLIALCLLAPEQTEIVAEPYPGLAGKSIAHIMAMPLEPHWVEPFGRSE